MAAAAFNWSIHAFFIHPLMAILTEFMCSFLKAVDICIANVRGMALGAFADHHNFILGMVANGTGVCFLVLAMRKISRLPCLCCLQNNICRADANLNSENHTGHNK